MFRVQVPLVNNVEKKFLGVFRVTIIIGINEYLREPSTHSVLQLPRNIISVTHDPTSSMTPHKSKPIKE